MLIAGDRNRGARGDEHGGEEKNRGAGLVAREQNPPARERVREPARDRAEQHVRKKKEERDARLDARRLRARLMDAEHRPRAKLNKTIAQAGGGDAGPEQLEAEVFEQRRGGRGDNRHVRGLRGRFCHGGRLPRQS